MIAMIEKGDCMKRLFLMLVSTGLVLAASCPSYAFLFFRIGGGSLPDIPNETVASDSGMLPRLVVTPDGDCVVVHEFGPGTALNDSSQADFRKRSGRLGNSFSVAGTMQITGQKVNGPSVAYTAGMYFYSWGETRVSEVQPLDEERYLVGVGVSFDRAATVQLTADGVPSGSWASIRRSSTPCRTTSASCKGVTFIAFQTTDEAFASTPVLVTSAGARTTLNMVEGPFNAPYDTIPRFTDYPKVLTGKTDNQELWQITAQGGQKVLVQSFIVPGMKLARTPVTYDFSTGLSFRSSDGYVEFKLDPGTAAAPFAFAGGEVIFFRTYPGRGTNNMASTVVLTKATRGLTALDPPVAGMQDDDDGDGYLDEDPLYSDINGKTQPQFSDTGGINDDPLSDALIDEDDVNDRALEVDPFAGIRVPVQQVNPAVAAEDDEIGSPNNVYVVWQDNRRINGRHTWDIRFARYDDRTKTVTVRSWVNIKRARRKTPDAVQPAIAVANVGRKNRAVIYVAWASQDRSSAAPSKIMVAKSTDLGISWSTPVEVTTTGTCDQPSIAVAPLYTGHTLAHQAPLIYVAYRDRTGGAARIMTALMYDSNPESSAASTLQFRDVKYAQCDDVTNATESEVESPTIGADRVGNAYVAWATGEAIMFARSYDLIPGAPKTSGSVHLKGWEELSDSVVVRLQWASAGQEDSKGWLLYRATEKDYQDALTLARTTGIPLNFASIGTLLGAYDVDSPMTQPTFTDQIAKSDLTGRMTMFRYAAQAIEDSGRAGFFSSLDGDDGRIVVVNLLDHVEVKEE